MVRPGFEVVRAILFHLGLETGDAPPVHILAAIVSEHLFGRLILSGGHPEHFQHVLSRVATEQISSHHVARVIVHEANEIGITASQPKREDIGLPHLIGSGSLKETRAYQVAPWFGRRLDQPLFLERSPDGLGAGLEKENPPQQLRYSFDPPGGLLFLELEDFIPNRLGQPGFAPPRVLAFQSLLALKPVTLGPFENRRAADAHLLGHHLLSEAFFQMQFDGAQAFLEGERQVLFRRPAPRGGGVVGLLYWFILFHIDTSLSLKCQPVSCSNLSHDMVVSTSVDWKNQELIGREIGRFKVL